MEIWEQLDKEDPRSFEAFAVYRDMGLTRTLKKVARVLGKSHTHMSRLSAAHEWVLRARAYDRELDRIRLAANAEAQIEMVLRHARLGQEALVIAREALQSIDPATLKPADVARLLELGVKTERISRGAPTEHIAHGDGDPIHPDESSGSELASEFQGYLAGLQAAADQTDQTTNDEEAPSAGEAR